MTARRRINTQAYEDTRGAGRECGVTANCSAREERKRAAEDEKSGGGEGTEGCGGGGGGA